MLIQKRSLISGKINTREIDVTADQLRRLECGHLIQDVLPHLSADDREFLITGSTPEEWAAVFPDEDEE